VRPHQATFVPDSEAQFTSDHGWSFPQDAERLRPLIAECRGLGVRVSLFMDPIPGQMAAARAVGADRVELYTEPYAAAWGTPDQAAQLQRYAAAAQAALDAGLGVNAGHDLNRTTCRPLCAPCRAWPKFPSAMRFVADAGAGLCGHHAGVSALLRKSPDLIAACPHCMWAGLFFES
jgi:pyridoxine 5'-phosphate synthase PdxJ